MTTEPKWEKCATCEFMVPMLSHPLTDGKSIMHRRGWACVVLWVLEKGGVVTHMDPEGCQCEMWSRRPPKAKPRSPKKRA